MTRLWQFWVTPSGGPWSVQVVAAGSHSSSRNFPNSASDTVTGVATVALSQTSLTPLPVSNATTPTWVLPLTFVVEFGEAVTGFTAGDVTIQTISMVGTPTVAANVTTRELRGSSNSTYTLGVNPPYENGTFIVKIAVAAATAVRSQYHKTPALTSTVVVGVNCPPVCCFIETASQFVLISFLFAITGSMGTKPKQLYNLYWEQILLGRCKFM